MSSVIFGESVFFFKLGTKYFMNIHQEKEYINKK